MANGDIFQALFGDIFQLLPGIFWVILGALLTAWEWVSATISRILGSGAFTNILLIILIYEVYAFHQTYENFERSKWVRNTPRDID